MTALPVRRVVLYKHGVGYFEREADVDGDAVLEFACRRADVSDVLKSLTALDLGGGQIAAVSYDSPRPAERELADLALSVPDRDSLLHLLPQLKGARVSATRRGDSSDWREGTLLGVDEVETRGEGGVRKQVFLSIVDADGEVLSFDLYASRVCLLDSGLRRDLDHFLRVQLAGRRRDRRTFAFRATGSGRRTVRLGYVVEAPVWKATYRLLLAGDDSTEPPLIQGWAVVDNPTDEDWNGIELALVAGLPVSFTHDLATPRYLRRPSVAVQETSGVLPPMVEEAIAQGDSEFELALDGSSPPPTRKPKEVFTRSPSGGPLVFRETPARSYAEIAKGGTMRDAAVTSTPVQTRERQVGELFEYAIDQSVTIRRDQSALVPIVLKPFDGRSVLLYQKEARAQNPLRCVEFDNTTGLTLEGGPVTVLQEDRYVGEAMLDTTRPGEQRLLAYAVELGVRVTDSINSGTEPVRQATVHAGILRSHAGIVNTTTYVIQNKTAREETLYLDHPRWEAGWELREATAHEVTDHFWRFRLTLPANETTTFRVRSERLTETHFDIGRVPDDKLLFWIESRHLNAATAVMLTRIMDLRRQVADVEAEIRRLTAERTEIHQEQQRIRENLQSLGDRPSEKELREWYIRTLTEQETRLTAITGEVRTREAERDASRARLTASIAGLEFDGRSGS